ncbi:MAG: SDR family NAD(P)-dependent oxidoreductase [Oscillospiraceae bacterium]
MLKGKVAVVTGGTRGIGFATAKLFLENGASVAIFGSKQESVDKAIAKLKAEKASYPVIGFCPELFNVEQVGAAFAEIVKAYGKVDILANIAGITQVHNFYTYPIEEFQKIININLVGTFVCGQAAARIMKENGGGSIINTSSIAGIYAQSANVGYPTSKFAVNGLTRTMARELGKDQIRVNAVAPGVTKTDMVNNLPKEYIAPMEKAVPLGRLGEPEEVAAAYLFLASDVASYTTGTIISVDGASLC